MKKKFSKERFYKKLEAQNMANFNALEFAQACSALSIAMQKAAMMFQAMCSSVAEMFADIQHFKEHGVPREKLQTFVIHAGENKNPSPEHTAKIKELLNSDFIKSQRFT